MKLFCIAFTVGWDMEPTYSIENDIRIPIQSSTYSSVSFGLVSNKDIDPFSQDKMRKDGNNLIWSSIGRYIADLHPCKYIHKFHRYLAASELCGAHILCLYKYIISLIKKCT